MIVAQQLDRTHSRVVGSVVMLNWMVSLLLKLWLVLSTSTPSATVTWVALITAGDAMIDRLPLPPAVPVNPPHGREGVI